MPTPTDFSGAWEAAIGDSVFRMPPPGALRMWIDHKDGEILHRVLTVAVDGTERSAELRYVVGQRLEAQIAGQPAIVEARWDGATLVIDSEVGAQRLRLSDHWSLSDDGATLTMAHPDDVLAGQVCVLRRVVE